MTRILHYRQDGVLQLRNLTVVVCEELLVADGFQRRRRFVVSHLPKGFDFIQKTVLNQFQHPSVDSVVQPLPVHRDSEQPEVISFPQAARIQVLYVGAEFVRFDGTNHLSGIVGMNSFRRFRIHRRQNFVHVFAAHLLRHIFQFPAALSAVGRFRRKIHIVQHGIQVQSGTAAQNRRLAPCQNIIDGLQCHFLIPRHCHILFRIDDAVQMMRHGAHIRRTRLGTADIQIFVQLNGIAIHDFAVNPPGKVIGNYALSNRCRPGNNINCFLLCRHNSFLAIFF